MSETPYIDEQTAKEFEELFTEYSQGTLRSELLQNPAVKDFCRDFYQFGKNNARKTPEKFVFVPREYEKEDIEANFEVKLSDEEFRDFAEFTRDNDGTMDLIDRDIQAALKYWKETRESERMPI